MDAALGLGGSVLVGKADEAALALGGIVEPGDGIALELEVDEAGAAVLGDGDGVLGVADGGVSLGVEGVVGCGGGLGCLVTRRVTVRWGAGEVGSG